MATLRNTVRSVWNGLRNILGDDAYERYLDHQHRRHPDTVPLERAAFYQAELERRWSGINRCC
jgi:uncharacterized short protein YbdD (DUF466 family)